MSCGGVAQVFFEKQELAHRWPVAIFGGGHVGQALVRALLPLDVELHCFETRSEWLQKWPETPHLKRYLLADMAAAIETLPERAFIVIMTMGHASDLPILAAALRRGFPYIGNLGSQQKAKALRAELSQLGLAAETINKFYCPMGEPIGNNSPAEIAISIAAQLLRVRDEGLVGKSQVMKASD
jgi:xanthine dehydrogenase accessory factor